MSNIWVTSDWHIGHTNICNFDKTWGTELERRTIVVDRYREMVNKRDKVYFLGDMIFNKNLCHVVKDLPGRKVLILGNHDTDRNIRPSMSDLMEVFDEIHGFVKYKMFWMSHCPIHWGELRGKTNIHGHVHMNTMLDHYHQLDKRYINACLEANDYRPLNLNVLVNNHRKVVAPT